MSDLLHDLIENEQVSTNEVVDNGQKSTWLIFSMVENYYALPTKFVKEILRNSEVFSIPFVPQYLNGVLNRYGDPYAVVDPALLIGKKKQDASLFIVINDESRTCFRISDVIEFYSTNEDEVRRFSEPEQFMEGSFDYNGKPVFILNTQAILDKVFNELKNV